MDDRTLARFIANVEIRPNGCWYWTGRTQKDGYGTFHVDGKHELAHRVSYKHFIGEIPDGLELDHLCHTRDESCPGGKGDQHRRCVNPFTDLEPVTSDVNRMRGMAIPAVNARKTHCAPGDHEFTPENTYIGPDGKRECRECRAERGRRWVAEHNPGVRHGTETHCPQNHPYSGDNLIITVNGGRACRECKRDWNREYMRRKRAAAKAARAA